MGLFTLGLVQWSRLSWPLLDVDAEMTEKHWKCPMETKCNFLLN